VEARSQPRTGRSGLGETCSADCDSTDSAIENWLKFKHLRAREWALVGVWAINSEDY
jgi:hypothetical protein